MRKIEITIMLMTNGGGKSYLMVEWKSRRKNIWEREVVNLEHSVKMCLIFTRMEWWCRSSSLWVRRRLKRSASLEPCLNGVYGDSQRCLGSTSFIFNFSGKIDFLTLKLQNKVQTNDKRRIK